MGKQSRLEQEAIEKRKELEVKIKYNSEEQYTEESSVKGTGTTSNPYLVPDRNGSKTTYKPTVNTMSGGSEVDKDKRLGLEVINLYGPTNEYGENSIDTSANKGQVIIR